MQPDQSTSMQKFEHWADTEIGPLEDAPAYITSTRLALRNIARGAWEAALAESTERSAAFLFYWQPAIALRLMRRKVKPMTAWP
jgi:hypothetical protein